MYNSTLTPTKKPCVEFRMATEQSKFGASAADELQRNDMVNVGNGVLTAP
jgi:hypothetical protein